jgi:hypothetical protein
MYRRGGSDNPSNQKIRTGKDPAEVPLDETGVEFDEDKIDRIELFYEDSPEATIRATVNRLLSDRDEGMGLV